MEKQFDDMWTTRSPAPQVNPVPTTESQDDSYVLGPDATGSGLPNSRNMRPITEDSETTQSESNATISGVPPRSYESWQLMFRKFSHGFS